MQRGAPDHEAAALWRLAFRILVGVLLLVSLVSLKPGWLPSTCCCWSMGPSPGRVVKEAPDPYRGGRWEERNHSRTRHEDHRLWYVGEDPLGESEIVQLGMNRSSQWQPVAAGLGVTVYTHGAAERVLIDNDMLDTLRRQGPWNPYEQPTPAPNVTPPNHLVAAVFLVLAVLAWLLGLIVQAAARVPPPWVEAEEEPPQ